MREFTDQDIKEEGLVILDDVHKFCEEHGLRYILFYGSLIGAVRHKGYIPWDDDIDIAMPRKDYEYFIKHYDNERFGVKDPFTDKYLYLGWGKIYDKSTVKIESFPCNKKFSIGFNIDLFPIDDFSSPDNYWTVKNQEFKLIKKIYRSQTIIEEKKSFKNFLRRFVKAWYAPKANKYSKEYNHYFIDHDPDKNGEKTCLVCNPLYIGIRTRNFSLPKDMFENRLLVPFEGRKYYIPYCYDKVLTDGYGNYMQYPPKEDQVPHHEFKAYFK